VTGRLLFSILLLILATAESWSQTCAQAIPGVRFETKISPKQALDVLPPYASEFETRFYVDQNVGEFRSLLYRCTLRDDIGKYCSAMSGLVNRAAFKVEDDGQLAARFTETMTANITTAQCRVVKLIK
jgi:hypothetical protein